MMKFYCTAGRGTELFIVEEIRKIFGQDTKIISTDGKTYFTLKNTEPDTMQKLMSLKTVERIFVQVLHDNFSNLDRRGLLTLLHTSLNNKVIWDECISTLKHLSSPGYNTVPDSMTDTSNQSTIADSKQPAGSLNIDTQGANKMIKSEDQRNADGLAHDADTSQQTAHSEVTKCLSQVEPGNNRLMLETDTRPEAGMRLEGGAHVAVASVMNDTLQTVDIKRTDAIRMLEDNVDTGVLKTGNKRKFSGNESGDYTVSNDIQDKSKSIESDTSTSVEHPIDKVNVSDTNISVAHSKNGLLEVENGSNNTVPHLHNATDMTETENNAKERSVSSSSSKVFKNRYVSNTSKCPHSSKRRKLDRDYKNTDSFRVSCRFSGYARKQLNVQRTSQQMGVLISKLLGWKIDLKHPKYEINIHLGDGTFTVGIPLTDIPLSKRSYIKHCGLRTTIAYIMASLVDIGPGNVILDPMCGCATILIEASKVFQNAIYIGMDIDTSQLSLAAENIIHCCQDNHGNSGMSLIHGDTRHIPLADNSVDGVITDAPFGQNHVVTGDLYTFYHKMLSELARVVKPDRKIILLTSSDMVQFVTKLCSDTLTNILSETVTTFEGSESQREVGHFDSENDSQVNDVMDKTRQELIEECSRNSNIDKVPSESLLPLLLTAAYHVKLGETEGCILVIQKSARTKIS